MNIVLSVIDKVKCLPEYMTEAKFNDILWYSILHGSREGNWVVSHQKDDPIVLCIWQEKLRKFRDV